MRDGERGTKDGGPPHHSTPPLPYATIQIAFFDRNDTGELTSRLSADAAKLSNVVSFHINIIVRQSIQVLT